MRFQIITIFPHFFDSPLSHGLLDKAQDDDRVIVDAIDLREFAKGKHRQTDDTPYGGGPGMVMKPEPLAAAIAHAKSQDPTAQVFALSPGGRRLDDALARELAQSGRGMILICGRYEGMDQRIVDHYCDGEISIGDYVLTGGEPAAIVIVDAVARQVQGVIGDPESVERDSFAKALSHPQYTRPPIFEGYEVPAPLLSGNHADVENWRADAARRRTLASRPELLSTLAAEKTWLAYLGPAPLPHNLDFETRGWEKEMQACIQLGQVASGFDLAGVLYISGNRDKRDWVRHTAQMISEEDTDLAQALKNLRPKGSLRDGLRLVEKQTGSKPRLVLVSSHPSIKGSPESITDSFAKGDSLIFLFCDPLDEGSVALAEKQAGALLRVPDTVSTLPLGTQAAVLIERYFGKSQ